MDGDLGINVGEQIHANEKFGGPAKIAKGTCGTLHIIRQEDIEKIGRAAWDLSADTGLPAIIVVRGTKVVT